MQAVRLALRVRICRSEIGERPAQRGILQAESAQILAKGEIPVYSGVPCAERTIGFAYPARRSESGSRSETFSRRRARVFSPKARFPYFTLAFSRHDTGDSPAVSCPSDTTQGTVPGVMACAPDGNVGGGT